MTETLPFDAAEHLTRPEAQAELLADAVESGNAGYLATALGTIARARGMTGVAKEAGVTREALYKALSADGDPRLSTFVGVVRALGLKLTISLP
jgi:probable addiction module antidote protein